MNKKTIVQIIIIVIALVGSVLVLVYGGVFGSLGGGGRPAVLEMPEGIITTEKASGDADILPSGDPLNFGSVINTKRFQYKIVEYPKLNPNSEVGIDVDDLIVK